jgi:hypothetical protein
MSHDLEQEPTTQTPVDAQLPDVKFDFADLGDVATPRDAKPNKRSLIESIKERLNTPVKKVMAGLAIGGTLAVGGFAAGRLAEGTDPEIRPASSSAPAVPGQSESSTPEVSTPVASVSPSETASNNQEVLVQKMSIEAMDAMDLKSFAKLPLADRVAYAYAKAPKQTPAGKNDKIIPAKVVGYWQDLLNEGAWAKDKLVGEKIASAIYYSPVDSKTGEYDMSYKAITKLTDQLNGSQTIMNNKYHYEGSGSTLVDPDTGKTYINITFNMMDSSGAVLSQTETDQVYEDVVKLSDGRTIKVFTQGKGVLGQFSPVPGMQY